MCVPRPSLEGRHVTTKVQKPAGPVSRPGSGGEAQQPPPSPGAALPSLRRSRQMVATVSVPSVCSVNSTRYFLFTAAAPACGCPAPTPYTSAASPSGFLGLGTSTLDPPCTSFQVRQDSRPCSSPRPCLHFRRNLSQTPSLGSKLLTSAFRCRFQVPDPSCP